MSNHQRYYSATDSFGRLGNLSYSQSLMSERTLLPYYRLHPGRNRFGCRGHCVMSRQLGLFYMTLILLFILSSLFFAFDARYLTTSLSPAIPAVGGVLFLFVFSVLLRTSLSDPGILPRATFMEVQCLEDGLFSPGEHNRFVRATIPSREIKIQDIPFNQVYCHTCHIYRPPRTSHCSICDNCIERFDHHCPWIGNCIGARNYRYFVIFLLSLSLLCLYVLCFSIVNVVLIYRSTLDVIETVKRTPASFVEILFTFFLCISISGLAFYHVYLCCCEISTHEHIRRFSNSHCSMDRKNPFSKGNGLVNMITVLCGPVPPSTLRAWKLVDPEIVRPPPPSVSPPPPPQQVIKEFSMQNKQSATARPLRFDSDVQPRRKEEEPRDTVDGKSRQHSRSPNAIPLTNQNTAQQQMPSTLTENRRGKARKAMLDEHGDQMPTAGFAGRAIVAVTASQSVRIDRPDD